jgi:hypothetical protein
MESSILDVVFNPQARELAKIGLELLGGEARLDMTPELIMMLHDATALPKAIVPWGG